MVPPVLSDAEEAELQARMKVDPDAREMTAEELGRMRPARAVLPPAVFEALTKREQIDGAAERRYGSFAKLP